ncbi:BNR-4 repeat-containing protein [Paenibacillus sp. FJAT-26967]|uniref:BNR-4 repeat-containing protein n=1 Tax=Paenibacillus sp. FJAT-26967 TaxID=1729690 RepID=UPI000B128EE8|nr:BNR-4 repeat-containing protein [Paenibacillus sp. FJAT-26967]
MKKGIRLKIGMAALMLAALLPAGTGSSAAALTEVPYAMDSSNQAGWWTPLETYGTGLEYAYMAYNAPGSIESTHKVNIARRDGNGVWSNIPVMDGSKVAEFSDNVGHSQPSIARDGSGRFHVFASMHDTAWNYFRSDTAGGPPQNHSADMPTPASFKGTYPVLTTAPNGDVYLLIRSSEDAAGYRSGQLFRWDNEAAIWSKVAIIGSSLNRSFYPDDLVFDANGDLHILFEWSAFAASALRHELSYIKYSPSTGSFSKADGSAVSLPLKPGTADIIQPLAPTETYVQSGSDPGGPGVQSAKLAVNPAGSPVVAYRYREEGSSTFSVKYASYSSAGWNLQTAYSASETKAAIDITWAGSVPRVYYAKSSGTDRAYMAVPSGSGWTQTSIAPGRPIERLSVERNDKGIDILYFVDIMNRKLYYGRN